MTIIFFQILLNSIHFKVLNDKFLKIHKIASLIFFPLLFFAIPLIGFWVALNQLEGSPDAVSIGYSPTFLEGEYIVMLAASIGIQILFNLFGNRIFRRK